MTPGQMMREICCGTPKRRADRFLLATVEFATVELCAQRAISLHLEVTAH
jgi:hypothetical protein